MGPVIEGLVATGLPQPLLVPGDNPGWQRIRDAYDHAGERIRASGADLLLLYSTMWPSIIGHQVQAHPHPEWAHVDENFHDLGSIPYRFTVDTDFAHGCVEAARARGLTARTVAYDGFPVDTGSVVANRLLNPDDALPICILSSNIYADRAETLVLGKAARDTLQSQGKRAVTSLSNRLFTQFIEPADDHIHSAKDDEWNRKLLEFLGDGRLEDVAQLSRAIHQQVRVHKVVNFKPMWWLSAVMGQHNRYQGRVHAYEAIHGTGACVVSLTPSESGVGDKEFDEDDVEVYGGDRRVLDGGVAAPAAAIDAPAAPAPTPTPAGSATCCISPASAPGRRAPTPFPAGRSATPTAPRWTTTSLPRPTP